MGRGRLGVAAQRAGLDSCGLISDVVRDLRHSETIQQGIPITASGGLLRGPSRHFNGSGNGYGQLSGLDKGFSSRIRGSRAAPQGKVHSPGSFLEDSAGRILGRHHPPGGGIRSTIPRGRRRAAVEGKSDATPFDSSERRGCRQIVRSLPAIVGLGHAGSGVVAWMAALPAADGPPHSPDPHAAGEALGRNRTASRALFKDSPPTVFNEIGSRSQHQAGQTPLHRPSSYRVSGASSRPEQHLGSVSTPFSPCRTAKIWLAWGVRVSDVIESAGGCGSRRFGPIRSGLRPRSQRTTSKAFAASDDSDVYL